jgi:hypothetical protein
MQASQEVGSKRISGFLILKDDSIPKDSLVDAVFCGDDQNATLRVLAGGSMW